jgi:hypothetical protein
MTIAQIGAMQLLLHDGSSAFTYYQSGATDADVCWAAQVVDGVTLILLRGSVNFKDWVKDLDAFADPFAHATLGPVNEGFFLGAEKAWADIQVHTQPPWIVSGHSLGAARSAYLAAFMTLAGHPPLARVAFAEPKPGFRQLADIIAKVPQFSYRNGDAHLHDLITDYPLTFPPEDYVHPSPLLEVTASPSLAEYAELAVLAWHRMALYAKAVSQIATEVS